MTTIDLFAGPGGWDLAARDLGLDPLGIEWDDAACATRAAAGLWTLQADVATAVIGHGGMSIEDHRAQRYHHWPAGTVWGLIASPPCQAFSMAGKGEGRAAMRVYLAEIERMRDGHPIDRTWLDERCDDERAHLVLEPLRWALALRPRWVALEQVEPVLPLWEAMAVALRRTGYQAWTGVPSAEQYGVPQTRRRAILLAALDGPVTAPPATHQRYIAPRHRDEATDSLFAVPEPGRIVAPEDRDLLPWVSMAEALGWGRDRRSRVQWVYNRPATTVNGDPRIAEPGRHEPTESGSQYGPATVRVTIEEAAVLQSFPPDHPWQGTKTKRFEQVGNAVPPLLAWHVLRVVAAPVELREAA